MAVSQSENKGERIAKRMARGGVASRRDAEAMILAGRVMVNGQSLTSPAFLVKDSDKIVIDGKPLPASPATRLFCYHKPKGLVVTHKDEEGRPTVFEQLPEELGRLISVGRLDYFSEGLLLLTNDGGLARRLELPESGYIRTYRARVYGDFDKSLPERLAQGMVVDGVYYRPANVSLAIMDSENKQNGKRNHQSEVQPKLASQPRNFWLTISLSEGKNREVRKLLAACGLSVNRLVRIAYGPLRLDKLRPGDLVEVKDLTILNRQARAKAGHSPKAPPSRDMLRPQKRRQSYDK